MEDSPATPNPVMDVVAPPPRTADETAPAPVPTANPPKPQAPAAPAHQKAPVQAKQPRANSVNTAIFATVIIVLGLAALAVYAYLKQK